MPTLFSHPVVAIALKPWFDSIRGSKTVLFVGVLFTILPDIDIIGFRLGIPYTHLFGHRGFTHSIFFALFSSGCIAWLMSRRCSLTVSPIWLFLFLCIVSHGLFDALTNGGHGIAFLSPFSNERYFFPVQPIEVSTLNIRRFFEGQGLAVIISELKWVWLPGVVLFLCGYFYRKKVRQPESVHTEKRSG
ncbi:MAG: hypothetical protein CO186_10805 [Zetaproteobacteria bacterium CG_4_9_14_3_um_filter_49_83]|nr:MAG: hypothetical protein AUJ56_09195 [Zetaproteobacteria bacterium CG1_02_49_23]PIQ33341.1 MAG: hydrolase [Zetaproteobacteria bacterium CG17_big_fil_post_rev_8_21_14_2_50_50_13]PIV31054.1 MAG: hypothetical protein COS35_03370 [Zetaproteobacteria bacterium CG02_land_8_20_14_3_00_50_9]PIY57077.1 MAG: hypothetical protein COZ00_00910 [Zetaproteobacteria bacterium CG_4_10_14_0_8_um_filter_49_80]PJA34383.1 MAG: hypothetical protein CO186_10805 [Zetaproteobacteria bacterium CG_4_9_14_3_um_filter_